MGGSVYKSKEVYEDALFLYLAYISSKDGYLLTSPGFNSNFSKFNSIIDVYEPILMDGPLFLYLNSVYDYLASSLRVT